jgi:hypothetical protein
LGEALTRKKTIHTIAIPVFKTLKALHININHDTIKHNNAQRLIKPTLKVSNTAPIQQHKHLSTRTHSGLTSTSRAPSIDNLSGSAARPTTFLKFGHAQTRTSLCRSVEKFSANPNFWSDFGYRSFSAVSAIFISPFFNVG